MLLFAKQHSICQQQTRISNYNNHKTFNRVNLEEILPNYKNQLPFENLMLAKAVICLQAQQTLKEFEELETKNMHF